MDHKMEFILDGLCCPNCASKIEDEVGRLPEISEVSLNLINNKLSFNAKDDKNADITEKIKKIVKSHEPSIKVKQLQNRMSGAKATEHNHEHNSAVDDSVWPFVLRLGLALLLTTVFSYLDVVPEIKNAAFAVAYLLSGYEILVTSARNIKRGQIFDENFLMGIASLGAFFIGEQVEAITVLVFYGIGELFQDMAVRRSKKNIAGLMDIRPDYANLVNGGNTQVVSPDKVKVGDIILVKPGERIPLDGIVIKGSSFVDTRALTGESIPIEVLKHDEVLSGTVNTSGVLEIKVTKPFGESTVTKILELVQNAGSKKAHSEKFITKFARYYTPIVVFTAVGVALFPPLFGFGSYATWIYRALSFLIISCPCALVISIPISFFGGIGGAARHGILIKGGNYLDALNHIDTIVFDKTGTLTKGVFEVSKVYPVKGVSESELIHLAALAEGQSTHPIAKSIISYYEKRKCKDKSGDIFSNTNLRSEDLSVEQITERAGYGIIAKTSVGTIYAGNEKLMKEYSITPAIPYKAGSIIHVAFNQKYMGYILISDEIKSNVKESMKHLKQFGIKRTVMLTGDQRKRAEEIARLAGIDEFASELLPQDKVEKFQQYKEHIADKSKIVFIGDGINDAPVLAGADIGIAMGGIGSDAAIEAADMVIMNDDIGKIVTAIKIARKTRRIVAQNIVFALGFKLAIMVLAFLGITSIWFAIFADVGVALLALLNAMRVLRTK
ncbi:heavy metal translocating P-type ATPase [Mobilitalea sibirica]|uniref:Cd(2+)-exporting ATPase n=1 Tax=Mobilitalea sibirica TaxID=1462919 RepID=A0A8J7L2B5_9FIRM|nr:heavy metal translocating P-type ATPase [Mobilitalea sibirica]MBH1940238.1 heavy metal translocating P-type ATPase [Mobilitalea sibirica]